ncbi:DEAD/DEAH box helicase [Rapidithrix thailandica]|uniref:DEAD-box ATP-dependent RNA helicase RhpA n=1 Tax=Rapidithrix thailandica TaxID=413964 RepID=A0AAW9S3G6_9BACT
MSKFQEAGLKPEIVKAVQELGFEQPTAIQEQTIPFLLSSRRDLIALAQTGTGKTAAFSLPLVHQTETDSSDVQTLILCPTRELCLQIARDIESFSKYLDIHVVAVYGGADISKQIKALNKGAHIVVGTPGRMIDLINRRKLKLANVQWVVLDEADEMLNMGFKDDLDTILAETPQEKQTLLFSATMPKEIANIAEVYMDTPHEISAGQRNTGSTNVDHQYYVVHARDRYSALKRIADMSPEIYGIIFCRTRKETKEVADKLMQDGYNADALHGDLSQAQRDHVMNRFRMKNLQLLVATDVAARGLDVNELTHVINYNLPDDIEVYIHRSGRTGRAGNTGISIAIVHMREVGRIRELERKIKNKFDRKMVPNGKDICEKQLFNLVDKVEKVEVNDHQIDQYLPDIYKKLDWLSREELIKHFVSVEFNRFLSYYKNAPDLNVKVREGGQQDKRNGNNGRRSGMKFARFSINLGGRSGLSAARLIGMINDRPKLKNIEIGKIEIQQNRSFFEVDQRFDQELLRSFKEVNIGGMPVEVKPAAQKRSGGGNYGRGRDDFKGKKRGGYNSNGRGRRNYNNSRES